MSTQKIYQPVKQRFPKRPIKEIAKLIALFPPSLSSCSNFFNFKQSPNLETHLAVVLDLLKSKEFAEAENILNAVVVTDGMRKPVSKIASLLSENHVKCKVIGKMFNTPSVPF
uniref:Pentatricopeptide repeat-containing protein n=1 Tax=Solanum tuberosum TaxID=4113 RepID=M1AP72_SOLTU